MRYLQCQYSIKSIKPKESDVKFTLEEVSNDVETIPEYLFCEVKLTLEEVLDNLCNVFFLKKNFATSNKDLKKLVNRTFSIRKLYNLSH